MSTIIGVISDTHIHGKSEIIPVEILEAFKRVDLILHAGDLVDLSVIDKLKSVCKDVRAVQGNMDPFEVRKEFPEKEVIALGKHRIGLMHGFGAPSGLVELLGNAFKDDAVDIIVFGHSHAPFNERIKGVLYFNPGSATDRIFSTHNSYGIIEINDKVEAKIINL